MELKTFEEWANGKVNESKLSKEEKQKIWDKMDELSLEYSKKIKTKVLQVEVLENGGLFIGIRSFSDGNLPSVDFSLNRKGDIKWSISSSNQESSQDISKFGTLLQEMSKYESVIKEFKLKEKDLENELYKGK